jgi:hypothetical protein
VQHGNAELGIPLLMQKNSGGGNRRSGAHGDVLSVADQARDYAGEELFSGVQTNSSR